MPPFAFQMRVPELPVEIFGVISEHLIGQHAFRSAASLNQIETAIHYETLPVLWESVLLDRESAYRLRDVLPQDKLKFTK